MNKKEQDRLYYLLHAEEIKEKRRKRYQQNKEKELQKIREYSEKHKEEITAYQQLYREKNAERLKEYKDKYYNAMHGRAVRLANHYKREDRKHNRGESTLTPEWIIDNIFSSKCVYCGESDWHKLGCDRKDNSLPHTEDNVVPCCFECNRKKGTMSYDEYIKRVHDE